MRSIRTAGAAIAGIAVTVLMVVGLLGAAPSADAVTQTRAQVAAASARTEDGWGSIYLGIDGNSGTSANYPNKEAAVYYAKAHCKKVSKYASSCEKAGWVHNACGAVWFRLTPKGFVETKAGQGPHWGWDVKRRQAIVKARGKHTAGGHVVVTCT